MLLLNLLMMLPLPHNSQFPILSIAQVQKRNLDHRNLQIQILQHPTENCKNKIGG
jgi:hypothetical protein